MVLKHPNAPTPARPLVDYSAEPPSYPDGHVCGAWCGHGEHCATVWYIVDAWPAGVNMERFAASRRERFPLRHALRAELSPEAPHSWEMPRSAFAHRSYEHRPDTEVAYRYWFTYPAHIEAAAHAELSDPTGALRGDMRAWEEAR